MRAARVVPLALLGALLLLAGCGGGGSKSTTTGTAPTSTSAAAPVPPAVARQANANCRALVAETKAAARGTLLRYHNNLDAVTAIVTRGIPVLERIADRQRALQGAAHSAAFDTYVGLFDPTVVLLQERLKAGKALDLSGAKHLDSLAAGLTVEQQHAARDAGLADCDVDFRRLVEQSVFRSP